MKHFALSFILTLIVCQLSAQKLTSKNGYFTADGPFCIGNTIQFKATDKASGYNEYAWNGGSFGEETSYSLSFDSEAPFQIIFSAKLNANVVSDTLDLNIYSNPKIGLRIDTTDQRVKRIFTDTASHAYSISAYEWMFNNSPDNTPVTVTHSFPEAGNYSVSLKITDEHGCVDSIAENLIIEGSTSVPNVFTPNGDGINDLFLITAENGSKLTLEIFNRWGYRIFRRTGTENIVWDGYNPQGTRVQPGTYYYVITVEEGTTNYNPLNGYVSVFY